MSTWEGMSDLHELAAAMRKGAALRPKVNGTMMRRLPDGVMGSCALGAAYEGKQGVLISDLTEEGVCYAFMPCLHSYARNPRTGRWQYLPELIEKLNDGADWSRERIADWLDTLQPSVVAAVPGAGEAQ